MCKKKKKRKEEKEKEKENSSSKLIGDGVGEKRDGLVQ